MKTFIILAMSLSTIAFGLLTLASNDATLTSQITAIACIFVAVGSGTLLLGARR